MATHSSIPAWRIPWTEEPGRLQFIGLQNLGHDWVHSIRHVLTSNRLAYSIYTHSAVWDN